MKAPRKKTETRPDESEAELHLGQLASDAPVDSTRDPADDGDSGTTQFIRKAVEETARDAGRKLVLPQELTGISPKVLLAIITYCYTKGVYSCSEIEEAMLHDDELRAQLRNDFPDDRSLRRFRRLNRDAIRVTLERAFGEAKRKLGRIPPDRLQAAVERTVEDLGIPKQTGETTFLARQAAEDRIQKALFIDGMTKDLDF